VGPQLPSIKIVGGKYLRQFKGIKKVQSLIKKYSQVGSKGSPSENRQPHLMSGTKITCYLGKGVFIFIGGLW
jgi:hypothetical protein